MCIARNRERIAAAILAVVCMFSMIFILPIEADAATSRTGVLTSSAATTQPFVIQCDGTRTVKMAVGTYSQGGIRQSGKVMVRVEAHYDSFSKKYLWRHDYEVTGCSSTSKPNVTLPKGYSKYRITIWRADNSNKNLARTYFGSADVMYAK